MRGPVKFTGGSLAAFSEYLHSLGLFAQILEGNIISVSSSPLTKLVPAVK